MLAEELEYTRSAFENDLGATRNIVPDGQKGRVNRIVVASANIAAQTVTFRKVGGARILRVRVPIGSTVAVPGYYFTDDGLEVLIEAAAQADVFVSCGVFGG